MYGSCIYTGTENWKLETGFTVYNFIFAEQKLHPSINQSIQVNSLKVS